MDKPAGPTSHDVVARVRRALGERSVGHTGTLDPFATGLLVVLVGRATRLARFVERRPKTYLATARLGVATDTDDATGEALGPAAETGQVTEAAVREALAGLEGAQQQRPPAYSAKKVAGQRSYRLARRGVAVELPPADVTVHRLELVRFEPPDVTFRAVVSAGTYVRALGRDLGERLGTGAHLVALRREAIGDLSADAAVPLAEVGPGTPLLPALAVLADLPAVGLDGAAGEAVRHGRAIPGEVAGEYAALTEEGRLVAVARVDAGWLRPSVVLEGA